MRPLILLLITFSILSSCIVTKKQHARICNECAGTDSIAFLEVERIVPKDTPIYISVPGPPVYLENPCKNLCDSLGRLKPFSFSEKKNGIKTTIKSVGNSIVAECETDSLKAVITLLNKEIIRSKYEKKVISVECEKIHQNWIDKFCRWGFLICIIFLIISNRKFIFNLIKKVIV